jgi:CDP-paratose 2-epimerase
MPFNIGGGVQHTVSLLELCDIMVIFQEKKPDVRFDNWRPSDQKYYVSDFSKFRAATGWMPQVGTKEGVERLYYWLQQNAAPSIPKKSNIKQKISNPV